MNAYAKKTFNQNLDMAANQKLPCLVTFKESERMSKMLISWFALRGTKLPKILTFLENGLFSVMIIFKSTSRPSMPSHIDLLLKRALLLELRRMVSN